MHYSMDIKYTLEQEQKKQLALKKQKQLALQKKIDDTIEKRPTVAQYKATSVLIGEIYDQFNQDKGDNPQPLLNNEGKIYDPESKRYCDLGTFNETNGTNLKIEFIKYLIDFMGDNIPVINMRFLKFINEHQDAIETLMRFHSLNIDVLTMGIKDFAETIEDPVQKGYLEVLYEFFGDNISFFDENITYLFENKDEIISVLDTYLNTKSESKKKKAENKITNIIEKLNQPVKKLNDAIKTLDEAVQKLKDENNNDSRASADKKCNTSLSMPSANFTMFSTPEPAKQNPEINTTNGAKERNDLSASSVSFLCNGPKTAGIVCIGAMVVTALNCA